VSNVNQSINTEIHEPSELFNEWQTALKYLKDGNKRYLENQTIKKDTHAAHRATLKSGQKPYAVIVTCSDSRVSPEIYFDQKLGDIFAIRNAGNIADTTALGSIEYAVEHLKVRLVVIVGHSACGAVSGALVGGIFPQNLQSIIDVIDLAIKNCNGLDDAIRANIGYAVKRISENETVKHMGATVMGAHYNIETGEVVFI